MAQRFTDSKGYTIVQEWLTTKGFSAFSFQLKTWEQMHKGYSGMVVAPTGFGKTFSVFLGVVIHYLNHPEQYKKGMYLLWVSPLRSLAKDLARAMTDVLEDMGLDWTVGVRNGDTPINIKQQQTRSMPEILIATPESLHLMLAQKQHHRFFKELKCIAVDEWHELLGSKRGVLVELALAHLIEHHPSIKIWGITATIGNLEEALQVLIPYSIPKTTVVAKEKKKINIISLLPDELEILPWAGHMGTKMVKSIVPVLEKSKTTLIFTNTRNQAETWYQNLLAVHLDLAGLIAIHHSSIDAQLRIWIEEALNAGTLKAVVCTSSLDLGVDFKPVDTVIQIGSSKGIARFLQRAGRSGHSPFETSNIYFVPTHSLELIEVAALKAAYHDNVIEERTPYVLCFDVLVQFMTTLALGDGFEATALFNTVKKTFAFSFLTAEEWQWLLRFITVGGNVLSHYEEFHKVIVDEAGLYKVRSRKIAMLHRINIGVIVSDMMMKVRFLSGGYIGMIEEYFITRLKPGDPFILAGRVLELIRIKEMDAIVRPSKAKNAYAPSWQGGRLPLTSHLSHYLRKKLSEALHPDRKESELRFLHPLLSRQELQSHIPHEDEFLIEYIETSEGHHLFMYPFEGRLIHEVMSALMAYRISRIKPLSFTMAMNDYGFELLSDQPIPIDETTLKQMLSKEDVMKDVIASINSTEMAKRKFRDIACISGLVLQNYPGTQKTNKSIQASSNLLFNILQEHDPHNLLIRQAYDEVFNQQLEESRLLDAFARIEKSKIIFKRSDQFTPLSFPIKVDSLRQSLSNEDLATRIERLKGNTKPKAKTKPKEKTSKKK